MQVFLDSRKILEAVHVWKMEDVQDILQQSPENTKALTQMVQFVAKADAFDSWVRAVLVAMRSSEWKSDELFQSASSVKKMMEAELSLVNPSVLTGSLLSRALRSCI